MVPFVSLVSGADHSDMVRSCAVAFDQKRERQCADMPSHAGAARNAYDQRHSQTVGKIIQIFEPQHQIRFLIADCVAGNKIVISQVLFRLFQLDHGNGGFRSCPEKLFSGVGSARRKACGISAVSAFVCGWNQFERFFRLKSTVDLFLCVFTAIRKIPGRSAALHRLVPDGGNPRSAVKIPKDPVRIINAAVHETDQDPVSFQLQGGVILDRKYPGLIQRLHADGSITLGDRIIGIFGERDRIGRRCGEINAFISESGILLAVILLHNAVKKRSPDVIADKITVVFGQNLLSACFKI